MGERKNPYVAAALGFFFGPFGLFYVSPLHAILGFGIVLVVSTLTAAIGLLPTWIACAVWGYFAALRKNEAIDRAQSHSAQTAATYFAQAPQSFGQPSLGQPPFGQPSFGQPPVLAAAPTAQLAASAGSAAAASPACRSCGAPRVSSVSRFCAGCGAPIE